MSIAGKTESGEEKEGETTNVESKVEIDKVVDDLLKQDIEITATNVVAKSNKHLPPEER